MCAISMYRREGGQGKQEQVVVRVGVLTQLPGLATQVPPGYTV